MLRESTSTSPDCSAVKRSLAESGVYLTALASPSTAAAMPRHTSTSIPVQLPASSGFEKPGRPWLTPHCTMPLACTSSSVPAKAVPVMVTASAAPAAIMVKRFIEYSSQRFLFESCRSFRRAHARGGPSSIRTAAVALSRLMPLRAS